MERTIRTKVVVVTCSPHGERGGDFLNNREYPDGVGWRVDDKGNLIVSGEAGVPLGMVAAGRWMSVEHAA